MSGGDVQYVMDVVIPLRGVMIDLVPIACQAAGNIVLVFQDKMDGPGESRAKAGGEFVEQIGPRIILDGVDGVQAKAVKMKLLDPIFGVLDEKVAHRPRVRPF